MSLCAVMIKYASVAQPGQSECLVSTRSRVQIPPEAPRESS